MRNIITTSFMLIIVTFAGCATKPDTRLKLEPSARTLRLGDQGTLMLSIVGTDVSAITSNTEGAILLANDNAAFVRLIPFKASREGCLAFGPYSLEFNGQQLTSDIVFINVLPEWDGKYGTCHYVDKQEIVLGEDFELVAETWSKKSEFRSFSLKHSDEFDYRIGPSIGGTRTIGKDNVHYSKRLWIIAPHRAGVLHVTKDIFDKFPEDVDAPDITVVVKGLPNQKLKAMR